MEKSTSIKKKPLELSERITALTEGGCKEIGFREKVSKIMLIFENRITAVEKKIDGFIKSLNDFEAKEGEKL